MAVISHKLAATYYVLPKAACTTTKIALWEIETGRSWPGPPRTPSIHQVQGYRTRRHAIVPPPPAGYATFTLVRDPVARLISAWSNKTGPASWRRQDDLDDIENELLPLEPSFGAFVDNLPTYRQVSRPVRVHTLPYAWHLGPSIGAFDHVFRAEAIDGLAAFLSERLGRRVDLGHRNRSTAQPDAIRLTRDQRDRLADLTADDYSFLDGLYDQDAAIARLNIAAGEFV